MRDIVIQKEKQKREPYNELDVAQMGVETVQRLKVGTCTYFNFWFLTSVLHELSLNIESEMQNK